jgi:HK97 family phage prohead protease
MHPSLRNRHDGRDIAWRAAPLRIRDDTPDGELPTITVYAVKWGSRNTFGEVFIPGCFSASLAARTDAAGKPMVMGLYHDLAIGKWNDNAQDDIGLRLQGPISNTSDGRDAAVLVEDGALTGVSVGFFEEEYQYAAPGETCTFQTDLGTYTYTFEQSTWYILKADVVEASLVMAPSDDDARVATTRAIDAATSAMPALRTGEEQASWEDAAYSMALLMGGRGAGQFSDLGGQARRALYQRLTAIYERHAKTPPEFTETPKYDEILFREDERELFHDRYLRKSLDAVIAGASGTDGPLSAGTRDTARRAVHALEPLTRDPSDDLRALAREVNAITTSLQPQE